MKFIYVFNKSHALKMQMEGYSLIHADEDQHMWVFENKPIDRFSASFAYVLSDVMTF